MKIRAALIAAGRSRAPRRNLEFILSGRHARRRDARRRPDAGMVGGEVDPDGHRYHDGGSEDYGGFE